MPTRPGAEDERALQPPGLAIADRAHVPKSPRADRRRLGEHAQSTERAWDRDELRRVLGDELAREPVESSDPAFAVVARQARIRRSLGAGHAVRAGAAHGRRDEVAAREAVPVQLDGREHLVAEHERTLAGRRDSEQAVRDLAVGSAHADLEHPQQHLVRAGRDRRDVGHTRRVGHSGPGDERLHLPAQPATAVAVRDPSTAPSDAEPTRAR